MIPLEQSKKRIRAKELLKNPIKKQRKTKDQIEKKKEQPQFFTDPLPYLTPYEKGKSQFYRKRMCVDAVLVENLDNTQLCERFNINPATLAKWIRVDKLFAAKLLVNRDTYRQEHVESSLFKRSVGYNATKQVKKLREVEDEETGEKVEKMVVVKEITDHVPADVGAIKEFLHQRDPIRWPGKRSDEAESKPSITVQIVNYASDTDPSAIRIQAQTVPVALPDSDAEGNEEGCIDLASSDR